MRGKIKRVYEEPDADNGFRILVDRRWSPSLTKESAKVPVVTRFCTKNRAAQLVHPRSSQMGKVPSSLAYGASAQSRAACIAFASVQVLGFHCRSHT